MSPSVLILHCPSGTSGAPTSSKQLWYSGVRSVWKDLAWAMARMVPAGRLTPVGRMDFSHGLQFSDRKFSSDWLVIMKGLTVNLPGVSGVVQLYGMGVHRPGVGFSDVGRCAVGPGEVLGLPGPDHLQ